MRRKCDVRFTISSVIVSKITSNEIYRLFSIVKLNKEYNYIFINHTILFRFIFTPFKIHRFVLKLGRKSLHVDKYTIRTAKYRYEIPPRRGGIFYAISIFLLLLRKGGVCIA